MAKKNAKMRHTKAPHSHTAAHTIQQTFQRAEALQQQGQLAEAATLYRRILQHDPTHADSLHFLGIIAYQQGQFSQAIQLIEQSLQQQPNKILYHKNYALVLQQAGREQDAQAAQQQILQLGQQQGAPAAEQAAQYNDLGVQLARSGQLNQAIEHFQHAAQLQPQHTDYTCNLGIAYFNAKQWQPAITAFTQVVENNSNK